MNQSEPIIKTSLPRMAADGITTPSIAVMIPCFNEEQTIATVVEDFKKALPQARIVVCDNVSTDQTGDRARAAGAEVIYESMPGKGNAVRRLFSDIEADIYVMVDGDATYEAAVAPKLVSHLLEQRLDMVCGKREASVDAAYRKGHVLGNKMFTALVAGVFGRRFDDILTGYRVFSRRFVKSFPILSEGFEIETELTIHALELNMPVAEIPSIYLERPDGSDSKLNTISDGLKISKLIVKLIKDERPMTFFGWLFLIFSATSLILSFPVAITYLDTGLVPRLPTAVLSSAAMLLSFLFLACGFILDSVTRSRRERKRIAYLSIAGPASIDAAQMSTFPQGASNEPV
ncbi:MAG: glycosyltransferase family 2 protein [Sneathiella sp.]|uniref:glycosyltransferase family 2 protein n=1 Tax=Sneathiella sp. TaxID=1964365 RepID=UPI003002CD9F